MKKLTYILLSLFTICTLSTNMVFAGDPIPGVDVNLGKNPGGIIAFSGQTGKDGKFACKLEEGKYELNISYSQIERTLSSQKLLMSNVEISLLLYSQSTNAKESIIATALIVDPKENGALSINIPKEGCIISGVLSYEIKSDGDHTSNDLKDVIIANSPVGEVSEIINTQQSDSPIDTIPSIWCVICHSASGSNSWRCVAFKGGCEKLYSSSAYFYSGGDSWTCTPLALALTNSEIHILLNREKDGRASFMIDGEMIPIGSDDFELFLTKMTEGEVNTSLGQVSTTKSLPTGIISSGANAKDDKKRNEIETFFKTDKGRVSDKRLEEISRELGIPIKVKK